LIKKNILIIKNYTSPVARLTLVSARQTEQDAVFWPASIGYRIWLVFCS
jgi:hypothetical protein